MANLLDPLFVTLIKDHMIELANAGVESDVRAMALRSYAKAVSAYCYAQGQGEVEVEGWS